MLDIVNPAQNSKLPLTPRQREIVRLVERGLSNKSIAQQLGLREGTVKIHLHHIYKKLGITSRRALVLKKITIHDK